MQEKRQAQSLACDPGDKLARGLHDPLKGSESGQEIRRVCGKMDWRGGNLWRMADFPGAHSLQTASAVNPIHAHFVAVQLHSAALGRSSMARTLAVCPAR